MSTEVSPTSLDELSAAVDAAEPAPLRRILLDVELVDGTRYRVRVTTPDLIRYELAQAREGWPPAKDAPMLANAFLAFAASKREGLAHIDPAATFERWSPGLAFVADAPASGAAVDPSQPPRAAA